MAHIEKAPDYSETESESDDSYGKEPFKPSYLSNDLPLPDDFLSLVSPPPDARPIAIKPIDFSQTELPEYQGCYAVVLDNVLSPSECQQLLRMAEASVPESEQFVRKRGKKKLQQQQEQQRAAEGPDTTVSPTTQDGPAEVGKDPWRPALVHIGGGWEVRSKDYRNGDRIIWDQQEVVDRIWARLAQAPGLRLVLANVSPNSRALPSLKSKLLPNARWSFLRLNRRMRFLKYPPGGFFRPHCDTAYNSQEDGKVLQSWYTVHLYLNDSKAEAGDAAELEGGATSFLSADCKRKIDINPKAGRVLIFQHQRLYHSGDDVRAGVKYTMRTDIEYQMAGLGDAEAHQP